MTILEMLPLLNYWHWLVLGVVLLIVDLLSFTTFFLWLSFASFLCAGCTYLFSVSYNIQILLFSLLSVASLYLTWQLKNSNSNIKTHIDEKGYNLIDREIKITQDLLLSGKLKVDGTLWSYKCSTSIALGDIIKVSGVEGNYLLITKKS